MSGLQDAATSSKYDAQKNAAKALLTAITEEVASVKTEGGSLDHRSARLHKLAEAYALVVHGTKS